MFNSADFQSKFFDSLLQTQEFQSKNPILGTV